MTSLLRNAGTSAAGHDAPATVCHLCGGRNLFTVREKLRHNIKRKVFQCSSCGLNFLEPKSLSAPAYYDRDYRKLYTPVLGKSLSCQELFDINIDYQQERLGEIRGILHGGMNVLDIGCSVGFFLKAIQPYVKSCAGVEYNKEHAAYVRDVLGIPAFSKPLEELDFEPRSFDLITAYQVFEHVENPSGFLQSAAKHLAPGGTLVLEVPNLNDALLSQYNIPAYENFWYRDPHLFNYTSKTLTKMLEKEGFEGETRSIARYGFLNHLHWKFTETPQPSVTEGTAVPDLACGAAAEGALGEKLNEWIQRVDSEYRNLIRQYDLGSAILYIGHLDSV